MYRLKWARWVARIATAVIFLAIAGVFYFKDDAIEFVRAHEVVFKLVGLGIGSLLAILGFFWGLVDKAELKHLAEELGKAKQSAEQEKIAADAVRAEVHNKQARIEALQNDLTTIADTGRLWKLRKNNPFPEYRGWKYDPEGAKIVTVGLFKGGVGKSHFAANFAAYVSEARQKPVLMIDLDYQDRFPP